jgi:N-acetylglucosamine-6-phosphate deacetylase
MISLGFSIVEASVMASLNPAKLLGLQDLRGSIKTGSRADLIVLDERGSHVLTIIGGKVQQ